MSARTIAVSCVLPEQAMAILAQAGALRLPDQEPPLPAGVLHELVRGAQGAVTLLSDRVDSAFLDAAGPQLLVVADVSVGYDNIDVPACAARGVVVADVVATMAIITTPRRRALPDPPCR